MADVMKYVHHLVEDLGARPANTEDEYYAATEIEKMMREHGVETIIQEFRVPVYSNLAYGILFVLMALAGILGGINRALGVAMFIVSLLVLVLFVMERLDKGQLSKLSMNGMSQNVIARHSATEAAPHRRPRPVVIVANYDSPKAELLKNPSIAWLSPVWYWASNVCMLLIPILLIFQMIAAIPAGLKAFFWVLAIVAAIPLLIKAINLLVSHFAMGYVQGANDNASGVAAMLGVLDRVRPLDGEAAPRPLPAAERYATEGFFEEHEREKALEQAEESGMAVQETLWDPDKKAIRRGPGVARVAGVIPEGANLQYVMLDPESFDEHDAEDPDKTQFFDVKKDQEREREAAAAEKADAAAAKADAAKAEAAEKCDTADAKDADTKKDAAADEKTAAPAKEEAHTEPERPRRKSRDIGKPIAPAGNQVRSRFADLPIDYKRPHEEEKEPEQTPAPEAAAPAAPAAPATPAAPTATAAPAAPAETPQFKLVEDPAERVRKEAEARRAQEEEEKKIQSAADVPPAPHFDFDAEDVAMPQYDAEAAVDAARQSGRISDDETTRKFKMREEDYKPSNISLVSNQKPTPANQAQVQAPSLEDDPTWGTTSYRPQTNKHLLDIPDPSVSAVDPFNVNDVHPVGDFNPEDFPADEFATGTFQALPDNDYADDPYDYEMPKENFFTRMGDKIGGLFNKNSHEKAASRPSRRGRGKQAAEDESLSDWLGVDEDFDAKKDGRKIGSWDNFEDDDSWKGGGTRGRKPQPRKRHDESAAEHGGAELADRGADNTVAPQDANVSAQDQELLPAGAEAGRADDADRAAAADATDREELSLDRRYTEADLLDRREVREAILAMGDPELTSHEVWFVATGASNFGNAGMKAFLDEYKNDLRGAFFINLKAVGAGDLSIISREGQITTRNADRRLSNIFKRVGKDLNRPLQTAEMKWADTDITSAMRSGHRAITLMGLKRGVPVGSCWAGDTIDIVDGEQIETVVELVTETIRRA